jgi:hypothetical protein
VRLGSEENGLSRKGSIVGLPMCRVGECDDQRGRHGCNAHIEDIKLQGATDELPS